jgi:hypothetical protein
MPTPKISNLPSKLDLALYAGDGASVKLTVTDNAGVAIPLQPGEVTAQIRAHRLDADALVEFNANFDDLVPNTVLLTLTGDQTASIITDEDVFKGFWDVQWVAENQEPVTLAQGKVEVDADVTRS